MAVKKSKETVFKSWEDVASALQLIADIDQQIASAELIMNDRLNKIKSEYEGSTRGIMKQKKSLETAVQEYTEAHSDEFVESKTRTFTFGEVGFRKASSIITRNVRAIIEALKQHKMYNCINVSESINKEELAKYDEASIERIGARRKVEDTFFYKIYEERIVQE